MDTLRSKITIGNGAVVLIHGGGTKIDSVTGRLAFWVKEGAMLCIINTVIDSQGFGQGVRTEGTGTTLRFEDVTFQRCYAKVGPTCSCCLVDFFVDGALCISIQVYGRVCKRCCCDHRMERR